MPRPSADEYNAFFQNYISKATGESVLEIITRHSDVLDAFYNGLPEEKAMYAYAPGKWTIKEVVQHLIDAERIFTYRLLRIVRNDKTPLPGFDENAYTVQAQADQRTLASLKEEFTAVRKATTLLLQSLTAVQLGRTGISNNAIISANALAFIIYGHALHHKEILEQRYLA